MGAKTEQEVIRAVYHKNVADFFEAIGLSEELARGEICCSICGDTITLENFRAVSRKSDELVFCCDRETCIHELASYLRSDEA